MKKTFSRQFGNPSDSAESDMIGTEMPVTPDTLMIAATDSSFIAESGGRTYGHGRRRIRSMPGRHAQIGTSNDAPCLPLSVRYSAVDGYYAENKFADGVTGAGYHLISELRHDANLRFLYNGEQKPEGRPEIYGGKVCSDSTDRSEFVRLTDSISFIRLLRTLRL